MSTGVEQRIDGWLRERRRDAEWIAAARALLADLARLDNTPKRSAAQNATEERATFDLIQRELKLLAPAMELEFVPIRPEIAEHPYFIEPYYTEDRAETRRALAEKVFHGRGNLFGRWIRPGRPVLALNAHIDTVAPHLAVRVEGDRVFGRGTLDDKGGCAVMMLAAGLLAEIARRFERLPERELLLEFVIDEERGGAGSLSAALEKEKGRLDEMIVLESTEMNIHPGNRGVIWYKITLRGEGAPPANLAEAAAFVVGALEENGRRLKRESVHRLWPNPPTHTNHGIFGPYGKLPSRVQDYVALRVSHRGVAEEAILAAVEEGAREYCAAYDDRTRPRGGEGVLERHFAWSRLGGNEGKLEVFGLAGHMGAVERLDGAVTKGATIIRRLMRKREEQGAAWRGLEIGFMEPTPEGGGLVMEGGQGYVPTHTNIQICDSITRATREGIAEYLKCVRRPASAIGVETNYEKRLHSHPFAFDPDGPFVRRLSAAARESGIRAGEALRGMDASCDARFFVREFPGAEVMTFGPGTMDLAHSAEEQIDVKEILLAAEVVARAALASEEIGSATTRQA